MTKNKGIRYIIMDAVETLESRTLNNIMKEMSTWQDETFGLAKDRKPAIITHLFRELEELKKSPNDISELVDIFHLLTHYASSLTDDFEKHVQEKFEINKKRTWKEPDSDGVIEHEKEPSR